MNDTLFFFYWISFSILVLVASGMVFYWALRKGHFKDQERARYLALWAEMPEEHKTIYRRGTEARRENITEDVKN
jgi:cbb3-type cytochrome oxidase maturation protein